MARLDTGWHNNPKILTLPWVGMALHAWSISYCDDALTDGFIPMGAWPSKPGVGVGVKALVAAGLWEPVEGGYRLHDYTTYNRTKAQVRASRAKNTERQDRYRDRHNGVTNGATNEVDNAQVTAYTRSRSTSLAVLNAAAAAAGPSQSENESLAEHYPRARAHEDDPLGVLNQPSIGRRFDREQQQQQQPRNISRTGDAAAC